MPRLATVVLLLLLVSAVPAWATQQIEERLVVGGRVFRTPVTPLEPVLKKMGKSPFPRERLSTNLWRGYVGTWLLEDDRLFLLSLMRYGYEPAKDGNGKRRVERDIPLSLVFKDKPAPVPATWWSGQLVVPQGRLLREGYRSRDRLHEKSLYLTLTDGRVTAKHLVDNRTEGRASSHDDLLWVTKVQDRPPDGHKWHDARSIVTPAFREAVPSDTSFRTRGVIGASRLEKVYLWIPQTPSTHIARYLLGNLEKLAPKRGMYHAELTATWAREGTETILRVTAVRALEPGETIHHPAFPAPKLLGKPPALDPPPDTGVEVDSDEYLDALFGQIVRIRGTLRSGGIAAIHGIEVADDEALRGKDVVAVGLLEKWVVTLKLLEHDAEVAERFAGRGPGTYYRLVHPETGALIRPRRAN